MENYKLLSISFYENKEKHKLRRNKIYFCILWLFSMMLIIIFIFIGNSTQKINRDGSRKEVNEVKTGISVKKNYTTIDTFNGFYDNLNRIGNIKSVMISDKQISLNIEIPRKEDYNSMVSSLESSGFYNIIYLSPLSHTNNIFNFKLILEVIN